MKYLTVPISPEGARTVSPTRIASGELGTTLAERDSDPGLMPGVVRDLRPFCEETDPC